MTKVKATLLFAFVLALLCLPSGAGAQVSIQSYALPKGGGAPHDVAVGADGTVWYTAQRDGKLGRLDPATGKVELIRLGANAAPHGVIVGPDGAPWVTEGGHNSIVRVDPKTREVKSWALPAARGTARADGDEAGRVAARLLVVGPAQAEPGAGRPDPDHLADGNVRTGPRK